MKEVFAIWPDEQETPSAFFADLEDATDWALARYGSDRFSICLHVLDPAIEPAARKSLAS